MPMVQAALRAAALYLCRAALLSHGSPGNLPGFRQSYYSGKFILPFPHMGLLRQSDHRSQTIKSWSIKEDDASILCLWG